MPLCMQRPRREQHGVFFATLASLGKQNVISKRNESYFHLGWAATGNKLFGLPAIHICVYELGQFCREIPQMTF